MSTLSPEILTAPIFKETHHALGTQTERLDRLRKGCHDINEVGRPGRLRVKRSQKVGGGSRMEIHAVVHWRFRGSLEVGKEIWELQHGKVEAIRLEDELTIPHATAMSTVITQHIQGSQPPSEDLLFSRSAPERFSAGP